MAVDIVLISYRSCIFAQNVIPHVLTSLEAIRKGEIGNESLRISSFDLPELGHNSVAVTVRKSKVQILIITRAFLEELLNSRSKNFCQVHLNRVLYPAAVVCILVKIDPQEILRNYIDVLPNYIDWNVLELRPKNILDQNFSKNFQELVVKIYNQRSRYDVPKIPLPRFEENTENQGTSNSFVRPLLLSTTSDEGRETLIIKLNEPVGPSDELRIQLKKGDELYSTVVQIPDNVSPSSHSNASSIVKIEAPFNKPRTFLEFGDDPIDQMILKFPGYKQYLDEFLADKIDQNAIEASAFLKNHPMYTNYISSRKNILPTTLHFVSYYGLKEATVKLLATDEGLRSFDVRNYNGETPSDLAKRRGNNDALGKIFKSFEALLCSWGDMKESIPHYKHKENDTATDSVFSNTGRTDVDSVSTPSTSRNESEEDTGLSLLIDPEACRNSMHVNIEIAPPTNDFKDPTTPTPNLPPRKISPVVNYYDVPPTAKETVQVPHNTILTLKTGSILPVDDREYIHVREGGDTLQRLNRNPIRLLPTTSISSSDGENEHDTEREFLVYKKPMPEIPSPVAKRKSTHESLDPMDSELVLLIHEAIENDLSLEEIEYKLEQWKQNPSVIASDEEKEKELERLRKEYKAIQREKESLGSGKETSIVDRIVKSVRNAKKKISYAGIGSPTASPSHHGSASSLSSQMTPLSAEDIRRNELLSLIRDHFKKDDQGTSVSSSGQSRKISSPVLTRVASSNQSISSLDDYLVLENHGTSNTQEAVKEEQVQPPISQEPVGIGLKAEGNECLYINITPPPRPPKKSSKPIPIVPSGSSCSKSNPESLDEILPPKPTRRNPPTQATKSLLYINYTQSGETKNGRRSVKRK